MDSDERFCHHEKCKQSRAVTVVSKDSGVSQFNCEHIELTSNSQVAVGFVKCLNLFLPLRCYDERRANPNCVEQPRMANCSEGGHQCVCCLWSSECIGPTWFCTPVESEERSLQVYFARLQIFKKRLDLASSERLENSAFTNMFSCVFFILPK